MNKAQYRDTVSITEDAWMLTAQLILMGEDIKEVQKCTRTISCDVLMLSGGTMSSGVSGGPVVDKNGAVVGISSFGINNTSYASAISQVTEVLDALGVEWTSADESAPVPTVKEDPREDLEALIARAEDKKSSEYTEDSFGDFKDELEAAKSVSGKSSATDAELTSAMDKLQKAMTALKTKPAGTAAADDDKEKAEPDYKLIIIIAVVAVVLIVAVVVVIVIVKSGKNNSRIPHPRREHTQPPAAPVNPPAPV